MSELVKTAIHNTWFKILTIISIVLVIASWIAPPTAVIDNSVLAAIGELFGFAALWVLLKAIDTGKTATVTHGTTTVSVGDKEEQDIKCPAPAYGDQDEIDG